MFGVPCTRLLDPEVVSKRERCGRCTRGKASRDVRDRQTWPSTVSVKADIFSGSPHILKHCCDIYRIADSENPSIAGVLYSLLGRWTPSTAQPRLNNMSQQVARRDHDLPCSLCPQHGLRHH